jgi:hypothetical protein
VYKIYKNALSEMTVKYISNPGEETKEGKKLQIISNTDPNMEQTL